MSRTKKSKKTLQEIPNRKNSRAPKRIRHFVGSLGLFGIGIVFLFITVTCLVSGEIYDYQDTVDGAHLPVVDAIVCLAGGRGRIAAAGDVWYHYWELAHEDTALMPQVPVLYFSGMGRQSSWPVVAKQFRRGILQVIRPENIVIENESSNTDTNAQWLERISKERHWKRILLLTSSYHMKRARFIFEEVLKSQGSQMGVETLSVYQEPFTSDEWRSDLNGIRVTLMEYLKWIYYKSVWNRFASRRLH